MVRGSSLIFVTIAALSAVIPSLAIVRPPLCNSGICTADIVEAHAPMSLGSRSSNLRRRSLEELEDRDSIVLSPSMRYVRDLSPSALWREAPVKLEARQPIVILPGMNQNIDTRLPWNKNGPRVLALKREFAEELQARGSGLFPRERRLSERRVVRRSPYSIHSRA